MYLILPNRTAAERLSRRLYQLRRPNPDAGDVTLYWAGIIEHPDGRAALDVSDTGQARIDPQAVPDELVEMIKDRMSAREVEDAKQAIRAARGKRVRLGQIIPQKVKDRLVTRGVLEADGWFPEV